MKFQPGDIALMELGKFIDNSSFTRLVRVRIETLSQDGQKALVKMLPPESNRKDVIRAEKSNTGRLKILRTSDLHRSKEEINNACEFRVGDVVMWCAWGELEMATVLKVQKKSARVLISDGMTFTAKFEHMMLASRPSNQNDPEDTEPKDNG